MSHQLKTESSHDWIKHVKSPTEEYPILDLFTISSGMHEILSYNGYEERPFFLFFKYPPPFSFTLHGLEKQRGMSGATYSWSIVVKHFHAHIQLKQIC